MSHYSRTLHPLLPSGELMLNVQTKRFKAITWMFQVEQADRPVPWAAGPSAAASPHAAGDTTPRWRPRIQCPADATGPRVSDLHEKHFVYPRLKLLPSICLPINQEVFQTIISILAANDVKWNRRINPYKMLEHYRVRLKEVSNSSEILYTVR